MADGARHSIAIIPEVTYGVTPATPVWQKLPMTETSLATSKDKLMSNIVRDDRQYSDMRMGARKIGGDIGIELAYGTFDVILEALLGGTWTADTPAAGTAQLKTGILRRSFSVERYFADIPDKPYALYTGVEFDELSLTLANNSIAKGSLKVLGQDEALNTDPVSGATYLPPSMNSALDAFTGVMKIGGTTVAIVSELQLSIANGLAARFVVGSKTTIRPSIARSNVSGTATLYFVDTTMKQKFLNETDDALEFTMPDGAGNSLKVRLPRVKYQAAPSDVKGDGPILSAMPFQALLDSVTGSNIFIERTPHA